MGMSDGNDIPQLFAISSVSLSPKPVLPVATVVPKVPGATPGALDGTTRFSPTKDTWLSRPTPRNLGDHRGYRIGAGKTLTCQSPKGK
jgi:hypothetical protein